MRGREEGKTAAWTENPEGGLMEFPSRPQNRGQALSFPVFLLHRYLLRVYYVPRQRASSSGDAAGCLLLTLHGGKVLSRTTNWDK